MTGLYSLMTVLSTQTTLQQEVTELKKIAGQEMQQRNPSQVYFKILIVKSIGSIRCMVAG